MLRDEDVLSKILDFKCDIELILDNFNESLIKKYEKKKLTSEYALIFGTIPPFILTLIILTILVRLEISTQHHDKIFTTNILIIVLA